VPRLKALAKKPGFDPVLELLSIGKARVMLPKYSLA
jgi:hypothetical protein